MGGFIKVSLRDESGIQTITTDTSVLHKHFTDFHTLFEADIKDLLSEVEINESEVTDPYKYQLKLKTPFDYGYIFIDRIKKVLFFNNNYDALIYFSNYKFDEDYYYRLKRNDFCVTITNIENEIIEKVDIRKKYLSRDFIEYRRLYTALPYLKEVQIFDEKTDKFDSIEEIIENLIEKKNARQEKEDYNKYAFSNDLKLTQFKEWTVFDESKDKTAYKKLFNYLLELDVLTEEEKNEWKIIIEEARDE